MTTDELIAVLAADLEPVNCRRIRQALAVALVAGALAPFGLMLLTLGLRPKNLSAPYLQFELAKLLFTASVVAITAVFLPRLARPGRSGYSFIATISVPFIAIALFATFAPAPADGSRWVDSFAAQSWATCLIFIPLAAVGPFVVVVLALRTGAPTELEAAGTAAGLVAGGLSAMACSLPCLDDSVRSIAILYGSMMIASASLGAQLGPKLLRW